MTPDFDVNQSAKHGVGAPDFFYSNLRIQESLATIRYGIEARKGLTVLIGPPGVGKSTLLQRIAEELADNVTVVLEGDPRVSFPDIMRRILRSLETDPGEQEESALVRTCLLELRARLERRQIVAVLLDNAHQFPDQALRHLTQNFLAGSAEDPDGTLLQIVLAGRPRLKTRLAQATLTALRRQKPIICELQPLNSAEIALFIRKSLESSGRSADIFDERAIKRIGLYANGNPGAVQAICARALQLAKDENTNVIGPELIESAVSALDLRQFGDSEEELNLRQFSDSKEEFNNSRHGQKISKPIPTLALERPKQFGPVDSHDDDFRFSPAEKARPLPTFPPYVEEPSWQPPKLRAAVWARRLTILILLVGIAAMIPKDAALDVARHWHATVNRIVLPYLQAPAPTKPRADLPPEESVASKPLVPLPGPDRPNETSESLPPSVPDKPEPPASLSSNSSPDDQRPEPAQKNPAPARPERRPQAKVNSREQNENLQHQIAKAIESRAIMGVEVSVVEGTAYLDGRVASERQRRAAERAARSVAGVERVRNRIAITVG
jgi:type II secretory pathway predicted ATPase ExeA